VIRAKFTVNEVRKGMYGHSVRLMPVTSGSAEDRAFFKATPGGQIELTGITEEVVGLFGEPGAKFYVDFTPVASGPAPAEAAAAEETPGS